MERVSLDAVAAAFGFTDRKSAEWSTLGKVTAVGSGTLSVLLGGSTTATECADYCGASAGDIVLVLVTGGQARAIARKGGGGGGGGGAGGTYYGTCSTAAGTAEKAVVCDGFTLRDGAIIGVLFSTVNSLGSITLNVNGTGAIPVYVGTTRPNGTTNSLEWQANTMLFFQYDGAVYRYITGRAAGNVVSPDGGGAWYGTCAAAADSGNKYVTCANFLLTAGALINITTTTASTVTGTITLNVSSTGSKNVYVNGASTSATNPLYWNVGDVLTFVYSGSYYYYVGGSSMPLPITEGGTGATTAADAFDALATPLIYVNQATSASASRAANSTGSVNVTLTAPAGFKIAHVLSVASNGGVVPAYVAQSVAQLTGKTSLQVTIWWHNGLSSAQTCSFTVRYLAVRDGFLTTNGTTPL